MNMKENELEPTMQKNADAISQFRVEIQLLSYDGSAWLPTSLNLLMEGFGGIGTIRLEDNLSRVGTTNIDLRLNGDQFEVAPGVLTLPLDQGNGRVKLAPGELLIGVPIGKKLELWTTAKPDLGFTNS